METTPPLVCNNLKCRKELLGNAVVTTCNHIFCLDCASRNGLASSETSSRRITCPLCEAQLANARDVVVTNLNPTEDFKTSVLGGLSPGIVMECARRALNFWGFQTTQNLFYQQHLQKGLTERYVALSSRLDQTVSEANSEIETLHHKIRSLELSQDNLQRKNEELAQAYKDKSRKLLQVQELYDRVKKKAEMSQMQQAASDAIDMTIQAAPEKFRSNQLRNLAMPVAPIAPVGPVGHAGRFDPIGVNTDLPRLNTHSFVKENAIHHKTLQPLGGRTSTVSPILEFQQQHANQPFVANTGLASYPHTPVMMPTLDHGHRSADLANVSQRRDGLAGVGLLSGLQFNQPGSFRGFGGSKNL